MISVYIRPLAASDLEGIYYYSVKRFGKRRAEQYIRDLDQAFKDLSVGSIQGRNCSDISVRALMSIEVSIAVKCWIILQYCE